MIKVKILLAIAIFTPFTCCSAKLLVNKAYTFEKPRDTLVLALAPASSKDYLILDSLFTLIFDDSSKAQSLKGPKEIRGEMQSDSSLSQILDQISRMTYSKSDLKTGVNLRKQLSAESYTRLNQALGNADIALFPVSMSLNSQGFMTFGFSRIRLFDMRSGDLIYEKSFDLNVDQGGENGKLFMALGLIGFAKDDFDKYFWSKHMAVSISRNER